VYAEHENELLKEEGKGVREFKDTLAYKLLVEDAEANLVINCMYTLSCLTVNGGVDANWLGE
jgi:hypothetical protein